MIYGNNNLYQPNNYTNPYNTPSIPNYSANNTQQNLSSNLIWVQGESGAKAYPVAPATSQVLFDSENQLFYIKSADQSGMPQPLRIFNYSECNESDIRTPDIDTSIFVTKDELSDVVKSLKSDLTNIKASQKSNNNVDRRQGNGKSLI